MNRQKLIVYFILFFSLFVGQAMAFSKSARSDESERHSVFGLSVGKTTIQDLRILCLQRQTSEQPNQLENRNAERDSKCTNVLKETASFSLEKDGKKIELNYEGDELAVGEFVLGDEFFEGKFIEGVLFELTVSTDKKSMFNADKSLLQELKNSFNRKYKNPKAQSSAQKMEYFDNITTQTTWTAMPTNIVVQITEYTRRFHSRNSCLAYYKAQLDIVRSYPAVTAEIAKRITELKQREIECSERINDNMYFKLSYKDNLLNNQAFQIFAKLQAQNEKLKVEENMKLKGDKVKKIEKY